MPLRGLLSGAVDAYGETDQRKHRYVLLRCFELGKVICNSAFPGYGTRICNRKWKVSRTIFQNMSKVGAGRELSIKEEKGVRLRTSVRRSCNLQFVLFCGNEEEIISHNYSLTPEYIMVSHKHSSIIREQPRTSGSRLYYIVHELLLYSAVTFH